ncbi:hypothetical protein H257_14446 [Aphanomyces astaci]|uniref:CCHC-type domain-containing protein n=1 Tax=Aphanomyces astaci TaxID=112090 RepID=W4FT42_APHAT|nr:hypothetical protein H257_14446 [Aphanomyces astaci]ETV69823.1 hypothetical protein H257_14446 [Aphanomyces astaci]|eukprot:XP_009840561.1 hypothetical protein H257_14446 [Aphanomyces astaci]
MAEKYLSDSTTRLKLDGSNYREWCVKTRAKINQQKLGKYLKKVRFADGTYSNGSNEEDDLVALSYIQLGIHADHLQFVKDTATTHETWESLKAIYESASEVNLVTLQLQMSKLEWIERTGLEAFADQFQEFMRKLSAAGDTTADKAHLTRFLCLLPPRFANTTTSVKSYTTLILAKRANTMDDALNVGPDDCHYCGKTGHYKADCRRRSADREKGIDRQNVRQPPRTNGGRGGGRGRGRSGWGRHDDSNYVKDDDDEDLFMVQEISIAQADGDMKTYRHETDGDKSGGPMELEDEIDEVTADLANYATMLSDDDDECNNVLSSKAEVIVDSARRPTRGRPPDLCHYDGGRENEIEGHGTYSCLSQRAARPEPDQDAHLHQPDHRQCRCASIPFKKDYCNIRSRTHLSIAGKWNAARLYAVHGDVFKPRPAADQANSAEVAEPMLWHTRCGHVPWNSMSAMIKATKGGPTNLRLPDSLSCEDCIRGKKTHTSPPKEGDCPRHQLGMCDATNYVWVKFLRKKSDTFAAMKEYLPWLERQSGAKLKTMRSDNGSEFIGDEVEGYLTERGIDYDETYAPVVRGDSLRLTLAIVTERGMKCRQGDTTNAYIHADSDRMLHMDMPDGFGDDSGRVWVIEKALYGMKQSALMWYVHFKGILEDDGSARHAGRRLCPHAPDKRCSSDEEVDAIFNHMQAHIRLNDMGSVAKLLGMEIYRNEDEMTMDVLQVTYIERMAAKYGLASAKAVDTPIPPGTNLSEDVGTVLNDDKPYRQIVGSLLYCAMATRPFIVHAVTQLSRHLTQPHQLHMHMERRVVAYLLHTKTVGLTFTGGRRGSDKLVDFSDSSWVDDRATGRYTCGYLWMMAGGAISWRLKLQAIVTLSTAEAEYVGACLGAQHERDRDRLEPSQHPEDQAPSTTLLLSAGLVKSGKFTLAHLPTNVTPADVFTKHVSKDKLKTAMAFMGMGGCCGFCP